MSTTNPTETTVKYAYLYFISYVYPGPDMPNFGNTTVVLPPSPTPEEVEMFVTLMGHFGRQTGYPALRVTVAGPEAMHEGATADFLVIGAADDQPAFDKINNHLPVSLSSGRVQTHDTQGFFAPIHRA